MTIPSHPAVASIQAVLARLADDVRELKRHPGVWIYVGGVLDESPPFENGWGNAGGIYADVSFYIDKWQRVHIRGAATGGVLGTVIFTLPLEYRPAKVEPFVCSTTTGGTAVIEVHPSGAVIQLS